MRASLTVIAGLVLLGGCGPNRGNLNVVICDCDIPPSDTGDTGSAQGPQVPVAMCEVDTSELSFPDPHFSFDGGASFSPVGLDIVGYEWAIVDQPEGAAPALSVLLGQTTVLQADAVGAYDVRLSVMDELGLRSEEPCIIRVHVVDEY